MQTEEASAKSARIRARIVMDGRFTPQTFVRTGQVNWASQQTMRPRTAVENMTEGNEGWLCHHRLGGGGLGTPELAYRVSS